MNVNDIADMLGAAAVDGLDQHPDSGGGGADPHRDAEGAQGQPEDLPLAVRRGAGDVQGGHRRDARPNAIEVAMPLGLYTSCEVSAPCGLCSTEGIIGLLDVPDTFLDPDRMKAGLIWFTRGFVEYQFPNNAKLAKHEIKRLEFSMELSSEVPGTSADWPSDITLSVNGKDVGTWTSPGDFGDKRGVYHARLVEAQGQPIRQAQELAHRRPTAPMSTG